MLRLRFWAGRLLRLPSVALGALLTLWAGTSAFGQGLHAAAAAGAWGALPLACVFAALAACLVLAQARYREDLLAGPFYPLLAGEGVLATFAARCTAGCLLDDGRVAQAFGSEALLAARGDVAGLERRIHQGLRTARVASAAVCPHLKLETGIMRDHTGFHGTNGRSS